VCELVPDLFLVSLGDLIVLTIHTTQIAVAKEDVARTACANERRLFTKMGCVRGNYRKPARITSRKFVVQPVVAAIKRAHSAFEQQTFEGLDPRG
jgi:hypothetical protein